MYDVHIVLENIKRACKNKKIPVGVMLGELNLNKNTLSSMNSRGSWPSVESLARMADYLEISLDELLGRPGAVPVPVVRENIIKNSPGAVAGNNNDVSLGVPAAIAAPVAAAAEAVGLEAEMLEIFRGLSFQSKIAVMSFIQNEASK